MPSSAICSFSASITQQRAGNGLIHVCEISVTYCNGLTEMFTRSNESGKPPKRYPSTSLPFTMKYLYELRVNPCFHRHYQFRKDSYQTTSLFSSLVFRGLVENCLDLRLKITLMITISFDLNDKSCACPLCKARFFQHTSKQWVRFNMSWASGSGILSWRTDF